MTTFENDNFYWGRRCKKLSQPSKRHILWQSIDSSYIISGSNRLASRKMIWIRLKSHYHNINLLVHQKKECKNIETVRIKISSLKLDYKTQKLEEGHGVKAQLKNTRSTIETMKGHRSFIAAFKLTEKTRNNEGLFTNKLMLSERHKIIWLRWTGSPTSIAQGAPWVMWKKWQPSTFESSNSRNVPTTGKLRSAKIASLYQRQRGRKIICFPPTLIILPTSERHLLHFRTCLVLKRQWLLRFSQS